MTDFSSATSLDVRASVHVWHAITLNDVELDGPNLLPGADWENLDIVVSLKDGVVYDWTIGEALILVEIDKASEYYLLDRSGDRIAEWNSHEIVPLLRPHGGPYDFERKDSARSRSIVLRIGEDGAIGDWPEASERDRMGWADWTSIVRHDPDAPIGIDRI